MKVQHIYEYDTKVEFVKTRKNRGCSISPQNKRRFLTILSVTEKKTLKGPN